MLPVRSISSARASRVMACALAGAVAIAVAGAVAGAVMGGCASAQRSAACVVDVQSEFDVTTEAGKSIGVSDMVHVLYRSHGEPGVAWNAILDRARDLTSEGARLQRDRITAMSEGPGSLEHFMHVAPERAERLRARREALLNDVSRMVARREHLPASESEQTAHR